MEYNNVPKQHRDAVCYKIVKAENTFEYTDLLKNRPKVVSSLLSFAQSFWIIF